MKHKNFFPNQKSPNTQPPKPTVLPKQTAVDSKLLRDEVASRAYAIYLDQGSPQGRDVQHWLEAEAQTMAARKAVRGGVLL